MIYTYVVKKTKGDTGVSLLLQLINNYTLKYGSEDFLLCFPGYMGTKDETLKDFYNDFPIIKNHLKQNDAYFFVGMNGSRPLFKGTTVQAYLNNLYGGFTTTRTQKDDHSKIIVFLERGNIIIDEKTKNIDELIRNGIVKAIVLGSSNQSYKTYVDSPTAKGEADIMLIDGKIFSPNNDEKDDKAIKLINFDKGNSNQGVRLNDIDGRYDNINNISNKIIVSKEISPISDLREILNSILV